MRSLKNKQITLLILIQFFCAVIYAQENEKKQVSETPWHNIEINVGGYLTDISTEARIGSDALGLGIGVDLEKALGLESSTFTFKADALYRFGKKKKSFVELGFYGLNRKASKVLATDIDFFDKTYKVGTKLSSSMKLNIISLSYGYSFFQTENFDVGGKFGFYIMPISLSFDAVNVNSTTEASKDKFEFVAPLPTLGLYTNFAFTPKLIMRQSIDLFYIKVGSFKGALTELNLSLEYNAWKHLGFGVGYNSFNLNFESQGADYPNIDFKGEFSYKITGLLLYVKGYF